MTVVDGCAIHFAAPKNPREPEPLLVFAGNHPKPGFLNGGAKWISPAGKDRAPVPRERFLEVQRASHFGGDVLGFVPPNSRRART